ncbi:MAG TPA: glycoside hydrolase family 15 protein [Kineosporiaceae bacterium]
MVALGPRRIRRGSAGYRSLTGAALIGLGLSIAPFVSAAVSAGGPAADGPGAGSSWTTGNKVAVGTAATATSKIWFTAAGGITTEVFYPRADVADVQDLQYVVTDGSTFVDLERDATDHAVTMPDERALEYTITNTAKSGRYRLTNTYVTDPDRDTLLIRTRFQSLVAGSYTVYVLYNPSLSGGAGNDDARWDGANDALIATDSRPAFSGMSAVATALKVSSGWVAHDNGYVGRASDGYVDLRADERLDNAFDSVSAPGNTVQLGQVGGVGADTTFSLALGFGSDAARALSAANGSLTAGFTAVEASYRSGWNDYVNTLPAAPASVSGDTELRRTYYVGVMSLHAVEDKTFAGGSVAGLATPWGDTKDADTLNDGYHRVWGRDLYQQATAVLAAGDRAQATRMARWLWDNQFIGTWTQGDNVWYGPGAFPRYSPVSGVTGATPQQLGCCEQYDQDAFAIILAWMTGLHDAPTVAKIKMTAAHIQSNGPDTPAERWEEQPGKSPSSIAAEIAGLVTAADIARAQGDVASAGSWERTADAWRAALPGWTFTQNGFWGDHRYYDRVEDASGNPADGDTRSFKEGNYLERDIVDAGFLELVRLGVYPPADPLVTGSLPETDIAFDGHAPMKITLANGDVYFHRYVHDSYGESSTDGSGWDAQKSNTWGRLWPLLSGERGEYELADHRSATLFLQSMADSGNDGYLIPEQVWDQADAFGFSKGRATGSAAPLAWAEAQYVRLARGIDAGHPTETPAVVQKRYGTSHP